MSATASSIMAAVGAATAQHGRRRVGLPRPEEEPADAVQVARLGQVHLSERGAHHEQVGVRVGEAREREAAPEVDHAVRRGRLLPLDADPDDPVARDGEGVRPGAVGVGGRGEDAAVRVQGGLGPVGHRRASFPSRVRLNSA
jgi:hypothetical protein